MQQVLATCSLGVLLGSQSVGDIIYGQDLPDVTPTKTQGNCFFFFSISFI